MKKKLLEFLHKTRTLLKKMEFDRAVLFFLTGKILVVIGGPMVAFLIATRFTPVIQGFHYTFASLLSLQIFVELGFGYVITQFASHEWAHLKLDASGTITGSDVALSRLSGLAKFAFKWYLFAAVIGTVIFSIAGSAVFSSPSSMGTGWMLPWLMLCLLSGAGVFLVFVWSLLEGCNQVANVYGFRVLSTTLSYVSMATAILLKFGLWTLPVSGSVVLVSSIIFLRVKYWSFLKNLLFSRMKGPRIDWKNDILPMQWRFALSGTSSFFIFFFFTPVLFRLHGPVIAGQFGLTWSVVSTIGSVASSWVVPKVPTFGMLIARKEFKELDRLFKRLLELVVAVSVSMSAGVWLFALVLFAVKSPLAQRMLPPAPMAVLLVAQVLSTLSLPFSYYLRAHKKEPLLFLSILQGVLVGATTLILGKYFEAMGIAAGYLVVNLLITPLIIRVWYIYRRKWHSTDLAKPEVILEREFT